MTIKEFCSGRGIESQAVRKYIERHPELAKHTGKKGREIVLKPECIRELEKVYPLPRPVEVVADVETMQQLLKAKDAIIILQQKLQDAEKAAALAEERQLRIEDKERQLRAAELQLEEKEKQLQEISGAKEAAEQKAAELDAELERIRNRNLWQRIFDK